MSLAKVHTVKSARRRFNEDRTEKPNLKCERCQLEIKPGDPYRWFIVGFRSHYKRVRCMDSACSPKQSERESSRVSEVYAAIEDAEATIEASDQPDEIEEAVHSVAEALTSVAEQYRESATNPNTGIVFNPESEARADELDEAASELSDWSHSVDFPDAPTGDDEDEQADYEQELEDAIQQLRDEALDAIQSVSF